MQHIWQHVLMPHTGGAGGTLTQSRVRCFCLSGSSWRRGNSAPRAAATCRKWSRLLAQHYYCTWRLGLWLPPWDGTNAIIMEKSVVTSVNAVKNQDNAYRFCNVWVQCITNFSPKAWTWNRPSTGTKVLQGFRNSFRRKRTHKWSSGTFFVRNNNSPFQAVKNNSVVLHPPHSPD